jgi:hypothetical protein
MGKYQHAGICSHKKLINFLIILPIQKISTLLARTFPRDDPSLSFALWHLKFPEPKYPISICRSYLQFFKER